MTTTLTAPDRTLAELAQARKPKTYPLGVHRLIRKVLRRAGNSCGAWRLRHHMLDVDAVRFPVDEVKTRLRFGQPFWVRPNDLIGRCIFYNGLWEGPIATHFCNSLCPGDVVLDVGANIGQYAVLAASRVGVTGRVFAVEPNPPARELLERNLAENELDNVTVLSCAAWDRDEVLFLDRGEANNCGTAEVRTAPGREECLEVHAQRLDAVLPELGCQHVDVVKLDIEGAEVLALRGLTGLLENHLPRAVYCEVTPRRNRFGYEGDDLIAFFAELGYTAWHFAPGALVPLHTAASVNGPVGMALFTRQDAD
jgi:FkbM family methyltransferase